MNIVRVPWVASIVNRPLLPTTASAICSPFGRVTIVTMPLRSFIGKTLPGAHDNCAYPGLVLPAAILAVGLSHALCTPYSAPYAGMPAAHTINSVNMDMLNLIAFENVMPPFLR